MRIGYARVSSAVDETVSIFSVIDSSPTLLPSNSPTIRTKFRQIAAEAIQPPYDEYVPGAQRLQAVLQFSPPCILAASVFLIDAAALCRFEGVYLQVEILLGGGNPGVANSHTVFSCDL